MSLLSIVTNVSERLSLPKPSVVAASSDRQVIQLMALANEEGMSLARRHPWQALMEEETFTTVATPAQGAALPADLDRFVPNSFFNRSTRRPMTGPITPRQWQWIQAQPVYSTAYLAFRERTGQFLIAPTPPAGETIAYEYLSLNWCLSGPSETPPDTPQPAFVNDDDTAVLDEELIALGVRWRFLRAKGLDYAEEMASYERMLEQAMARDGGSTAVTIAPQPADPNRVNIPDGNFG
jgi:hypothetical protein